MYDIDILGEVLIVSHLAGKAQVSISVHIP